MKPILLFLHIPKTAGTTMHQLLRKIYGNGFQREGLDLDFNQRFPPEEELANVHEILSEKDAYTQHICFGLHEYLQRPCIYLTFLREPISRSISHYNFFFRMGETTPLYPVIQKGITAFHTEGHIHWHNMQTRFLAGRRALVKEKIDATDLELAKQNLQNEIKLLGLVESFDLSLLYFQSYMHWHSIYYLRANQSQRYLKHKTLSYSDLNSDEKKLLENVNQYDLELYDYGKQLFHDRLEASTIDFEQRARIFGFYNRIYYFRTVSKNKLRSIFRAKN